jgi:Coenzyme PQQ synthesis protein D (PqqD)
MTPTPLRYQVCAPKVIHETLDGETVVVNLDTGTYYSLDQTGRAAWLALAAGATLEEALAHLAGCFAGDPAVMATETRRLLEEFLSEGLLEAAGELQVPTLPAAGEVRPDFVAPRMTKYTDMQELLLLDPVHEVDAAAGWPLAKPTK